MAFSSISCFTLPVSCFPLPCVVLQLSPPHTHHNSHPTPTTLATCSLLSLSLLFSLLSLSLPSLPLSLLSRNDGAAQAQTAHGSGASTHGGWTCHSVRAAGGLCPARGRTPPALHARAPCAPHRGGSLPGAALRTPAARAVRGGLRDVLPHLPRGRTREAAIATGVRCRGGTVVAGNPVATERPAISCKRSWGLRWHGEKKAPES